MTKRRAVKCHISVRMVSALLFSAVLVLEVGGQQKSDHYKTLGVQKNANDREIKKAYHKVLPAPVLRLVCEPLLAAPCHAWRVVPCCCMYERPRQSLT